VGTRAVEQPVEEKQPGYLGLGFGPIPPAVREYLELGEQGGVQVRDVTKGTPAEQAGLKKGDIIRSVNGKPVGDGPAFVEIMSALKAGDAVEIEYQRAGRPAEKVTVTLAERPKELPPLRRGEPGLFPGIPHVETGKGKIIVRWRDADGAEREEVIEMPFGETMRDLHFEMPDLHLNDQGKIDSVRKHLEESLEKARERFDHFTRQMQEKHQELKTKLQGKGPTVEVGPSDTKSIMVQSNSSLVCSNDGTYEISVRTENDRKTVTVKKEGKAIAQDLPFDKINTLPEDIQNKIRDLDASVVVKMRGTEVETPAAPPAEGPAEKPAPEKKAVFKLPTQTL
jgi:hypothetical protein